MGNKTHSQPHAGFDAKRFALSAMFTAIILIMAFTPFGLIDLPLIKATILHVPVIIGAIALGPRMGAFFGFLFGLTSIIKNTMAPSLLSFAFTPLVPVPGLGKGSLWAIVICFVPRILVGVIPWLVYKLCTIVIGRRMNTGIRTIVFAICGAIGGFTNTALVMGMIFVVFKDAYATARTIPVEQVLSAILAVVATNGIPEMLAAAVIVPFICLALVRAKVIKTS